MKIEMSFQKLILSTVAIPVCLQLGAQGTWTQKANFPSTARWGSSSFCIGAKGYLAGGYDGNTNFSDCWEYDPAANTWSQKASMPQGRRGAYAFAIGSKGYMGLGAHTTSAPTLTDFWEFDPATNSWNQKANFPDNARYGGASFSIGNKGYICCGNEGSSSGPLTNELWEYDPASNIWNQKANFTGNARYGISYASFVINDKGYVGLGGSSSSQFTDFYAYDPSLNSWAQKANYPGLGKGYSCGFGTCFNGYMGTGHGSGTPYSDFWQYNAGSDTWTQIANYGGGNRWLMASCVINGRAYVGTGYDFTYNYKDWWEYRCTEDAVPELKYPVNLTLFYPTVFSTSATLEIKAGVNIQKAELRIFDMTGRVVRNTKVIHESTQVNKEDFQKGIYLYNVINDGKTIGWGKFIIN